MQGSYVIDNAREQMKDSLKSEYVSEFDSGPISVAWNLIQVQLKSCGVDGKDDWADSAWKNKSAVIHSELLQRQKTFGKLIEYLPTQFLSTM